ncbi:MAG: hypothetical protein H8E38_02285 [SAR324 cluster bacterium]|nr:hypothetical protein [SAR324 cluster bacterium]MBL7034662.1 hypothetical protein [SAR324 cluster bacterium]
MAALTPMGALGEFSEMEKQIIFNSLQESLSTHYALASQKAFEAALTQAFEELDYDECTEDQCFALIQQILQVDNLFLFNMTREGNFTQLSLTRVDLDSQRLVRTAFCEDCSIGQLNMKVEGLVLKLITEDQLSLAGTKFIEQPKPKTVPEPVKKKVQKAVSKIKRVQKAAPTVDSEPEPVSPEGTTSVDKTWQYVATTVTVVSALLSYNAAKSYNDLSAKNSTLASQYANASSSSEQASYKSEYDSNSSKMKSYKSSSQTWDLLTLAGLGWTAYLLMTENSTVTTSNHVKTTSPFIPQLAFRNTLSGPQAILDWNLRF